MKKRAHKVLGVEIRETGGADNLVRVADPIGKADRDELSWASLSGGQQGRLHGHAYRRLGQNTYPAAETGD